MTLKHAFAGRRILVTGGTGFVGAHLVEALTSFSAQVVVPYQSFDPHSYFQSQQLQNKTVLVPADVTDYDKIVHLITRYNIDYIFHLAAQPLVDVAYHNPKHTLETNIMGTVNVLESARLHPTLKAVIVASSDKAYGKLAAGQYHETDALSGDHPYDVSKSSADLICNTYYKTYGTPVITTRFGNIYGEGDLNFSRLIPGIMQAIVTNESFAIRSNGKYKRDYLYVKDVVAGYLLLAANYKRAIGNAYNFGSPDTLSVVELVKIAEQSLACKIPYQVLNIAKNEIPYQSLNYDKARKIGWQPTTRVAAVLPSIFAWYQTVLANMS